MSAKERADLRRSLEEFGIVEPVAIREDNVILGGHMRKREIRSILEELKHPAPDDFEVPVMVVAGLDDRRTAALNAMLNKVRGEWDFERLNQILGDLADADMLALSGFSEREHSDIAALYALPELTPDTGAPLPTVGSNVLVLRFDQKEDLDRALEALKKAGMVKRAQAAAAFLKLIESRTP